MAAPFSHGNQGGEDRVMNSEFIRNRTRHPVALIDVTESVVAEFDTDGPAIRVDLRVVRSNIVESLPVIRQQVSQTPDAAVIEASEDGRYIVLVSRMVLDALTDQRAIDVAMAPDTGKLSKVQNAEGEIVGVRRFITRAAA